MVCPNCKAEYREGFSRCSDCDVDLVNDLPRPTEADKSMALELLWEGNDPREFDEVKSVLERNEVKFKIQDGHSASLFPSFSSNFRVLVQARDVEKARKLLGDFDEESQNATFAGETNDSESEEDVEGPDPQSWRLLSRIGPATESGEIVPRNWDPERATTEIWRGGNLDMAESVRVSLQENGIGAQFQNDGASTRILVYPSDESRAKEIIREIVEAGLPPADKT